MIYFIQEAGNAKSPIKIGFTSGKAESRLSSLQTGHPAKLRILCTVNGGPDQEKWLHVRFKNLRLHGEWFKAEPELTAFIEEYSEPEQQPERPPTIAAAPNYNHRWIESSGTTRTCCRCGCVKYNCRCCTSNRDEYSTWLSKVRQWDEDNWTDKIPVCDNTRPVPTWIKEQDN